MDLGAKSAAGSGRGVELDPGGVDVEFHGDPGAAAGQHMRQVGGDSGHARGVDKIAGGVLAQGTAGHVRAAAQGGSALAVAGAPGLDLIEALEGYEALIIALDGSRRWTEHFPFAAREAGR